MKNVKRENNEENVGHKGDKNSVNRSGKGKMESENYASLTELMMMKSGSLNNNNNDNSLNNNISHSNSQAINLSLSPKSADDEGILLDNNENQSSGDQKMHHSELLEYNLKRKDSNDDDHLLNNIKDSNKVNKSKRLNNSDCNDGIFDCDSEDIKDSSRVLNNNHHSSKLTYISQQHSGQEAPTPRSLYSPSHQNNVILDNNKHRSKKGK